MKIVFVKSAEKELLKLDKKIGKKILEKIELLSKNPYGQSSEKLSGETGYRIRFGDYRIVYVFEKENKTIKIIKIGHRRDVYKKLNP